MGVINFLSPILGRAGLEKISGETGGGRRRKVKNLVTQLKMYPPPSLHYKVIHDSSHISNVLYLINKQDLEEKKTFNACRRYLPVRVPLTVINT